MRNQPPPLERNAYFGDLHLHSGYSLDAFALGTRLMPDDSFNFARGLPVPFVGKMVKRKAPLDFLALSDHAEYLGVAPELTNPEGAFAGSSWQKAFNSPDPAERMAFFRELVKMAGANQRISDFEKPQALSSLWQRYMAAAERHNDPGHFTALVAFEWTSAPGSRNLHRIVVFRGKGPDYPFTSLTPRTRRHFGPIEKQRAAGLEVVAIPRIATSATG